MVQKKIQVKWLLWCVLIAIVVAATGCGTREAKPEPGLPEDSQPISEPVSEPKPDAQSEPVIEGTPDIGYDWNAGKTIRVPEDYEHLSNALRVATDGDTILLAPGNYSEDVTINNLSVRIMGTDPTSLDTIKATRLGSERGAVKITGDSPFHVVFSGITFNRTLDAENGPKESSLVVDRVHGHRVKGEGFNGLIKIERSRFKFIGQFTATGQPIIIRENHIEYPENTIGGYGILIRLAEGAEKEQVILENNILTGWSGYRRGDRGNQAISVSSQYSNKAMYGNIVIQNNDLDGEIEIERVIGVTIKGNTIRNNSRGIDLFQSEVTVQGNTISENDTGIWLISTAAKITNNIISHNRRGIYLESSKAQLVNNQFTGNVLGANEKGAAIFVDGRSEILDAGNNPIPPPSRSETETNNIYRGNEPDDIYFQ